MKIYLDRKCGYYTHDSFIRIYDNNNDLFYSHDHAKSGQPFPCRFNLPKGTYYTNNKLVETDPRRYKLPQLPPRERDRKMPKTLKVIYAFNPSKASIYFDENKIVLDYAIRNLSKPQKRHIILHEVGHYHYSTEKFCDLFAARRMLMEGYNPSQVFFSVYGTLSNSDEALDRKDFILQNCINAQ